MAWRRWKKVDREESIFVSIVPGKEKEAKEYIYKFYQAYAQSLGEDTPVSISSLFPTQYKRLHNKKIEVIRACHEGCDRKYLKFCQDYYTNNPTDAVEIVFGHANIEHMRNTKQMEFLGYTEERKQQIRSEKGETDVAKVFKTEFKQIKQAKRKGKHDSRD